MGVFQRMNLVRHGFGRVAGLHGTPGLEQDFALVIFLIHQMDGDARFGFFAGHHRLVDAHPVHSLAAESGQQRRMDVHDATGKSPDQRNRNQPQKTRQHDVIYPVASQLVNHFVGFVKILPAENVRWNEKIGGPQQYPRVGLVAQHQFDADGRVVVEMLHDFLGIRARTRRKNGNRNH